MKSELFTSNELNLGAHDLVTHMMGTVQNSIFFLDSELSILAVSDSVPRLTEHPREELVGQSIALLFENPGDRESLLSLLTSQENDLITIVSKTGRTKMVRRSISRHPMLSGSPCHYILSLEDMTERLLIFDNYERNQRILKAFTLSVKELIDNTDHRRALIHSLILLGKASMADRIFLYTLHGGTVETPSLELVYGWENPFLKIDEPGTIISSLSLEDFEKHLPELSAGKPYHGLSGEIGSPVLQEYLKQRSILALIVFPIFIRGEFWGFLGFDQCTVAELWPQEVFSTLNAFASSLEKTIERHLMENDLTVARESAEKASAMKSQFLSNMSHEIRTPINAILGYTSLLEDLTLQEEGRHYLKAVQKAGNMLVGLISDILDQAKIESGEITLQQDYINIRKIFEDIVDVFELKSIENRISLDVQIDPMVPDLIIQDETRFRQVLFNLIGNAVKFTHEGGILLSAGLLPTSKETDTVDLRLSVRDTGIGIPEADQARIFDPFKQKENQNSSVYGGTGLGLSIAKRLVEQMGGVIHLHSEENVGSEFVIDLYRIKTVGGMKGFSQMMMKARALKADDEKNKITREARDISYTDLSPEARTRLEAIRDDAWREAIETHSMDSSRRFARDVTLVVEEYNLKHLEKFTEDLAWALNTYDAKKIRETLANFPRLVALKGGEQS